LTFGGTGVVCYSADLEGGNFSRGKEKAKASLISGLRRGSGTGELGRRKEYEKRGLEVSLAGTVKT